MQHFLHALPRLTGRLFLALALAAPLALLTPASPAAAARARNSFDQFTTHRDWTHGRLRGTVARGGTLRIADEPRRQRRMHGDRYDESWWTSPWVTPGHAFTELIPSWNARTPAGTFLIVYAQARTGDGTRSTWQNLGRWAYGEDTLLRTSRGSQTDRISTVSVDTLLARAGATFASYRLRVRLLRATGTSATPRLRSVHAVASRPATRIGPTSKPLLGAQELDVPRYSQMIHLGEYPRYGGGGEAWCSPTALSMVLGYYDALPTRAERAWVRRSYRDRFVDEVARKVFDHAYDGTGNWPFNTAYAANRVRQAVVTRLASLRGAERFIAAGIPLEASISFGRGELAGAPIAATPGHLVVIVGFTADGDVVVNDPAAPDNSSVRRVYDRGQFEAAWQRKSHGLVYALRDADHRFPAGI